MFRLHLTNNRKSSCYYMLYFCFMSFNLMSFLRHRCLHTFTKNKRLCDATSVRCIKNLKEKHNTNEFSFSFDIVDLQTYEVRTD